MTDKQVGLNNNNNIDQSAVEGQVTNDSLLEAIEGRRVDINNKLKSLEDTLLVKFQSFVEDSIRQVKDDFTGQIDILKDRISQLESRPQVTQVNMACKQTVVIKNMACGGVSKSKCTDKRWSADK